MTNHQTSEPDQKPPAAFPTGEWVLVTIILSGPMVLIIWGLYLLHVFTVMPAVIVSLVIVVICAGLCRPLIDDLAQLRHYASLAVYSTDRPPSPRVSAVALMADLKAAISRLITAWQSDKQALAADIEALQVALDRLPDPIFMLSAELSILQTNQAAAALFPEARDRANLSDVFRNPELLEAAFLALDDENPREAEVTLTGPPLRIYRVWVAHFPKTLNNGGYALLRMSDQTEVKRIEQLHADFIANASHELKTPLATLVGYIETLRGPARQDSKAVDRFLKIMDGEAQRMGRLIGDLLSLSRIEREEHDRPKDRVDLAETINTVLESVRPALESNKQNLELKLPAAAQVIGDADQLTQVFLNLLDNAIKYSGSGQSIRIFGRFIQENKNRFLAVSVIDQGEGIGAEHLPRLSERFYRVDTPRSRSLGGTGLGLAIVKHILTRHAGRLEISSEVGTGSTFTVFIPALKETTPEKTTRSLE